MSKRYRPSNGTEGEGFMSVFCYKCERDRAFRETDGMEPGCEIAARSMIYGIDDPEYPDEWTYGEDGRPTCTAFLPEGSQVPTDPELEADGQLTIGGTA